MPSGDAVPEERPREEEAPRAGPAAVVPATVKPGPPPDPGADPNPGVQLVAYYQRVRRRPPDEVIKAARDVLGRVAFPVGAELVPAGHPDYEAVELFPDPAPAASPRPVGLFDRPWPTGRVSPPAVPRRDPARPANILDMLAADPAPTAVPPTPQPIRPGGSPQAVATPQTAEPPVAPPLRPASVTVERGR